MTYTFPERPLVVGRVASLPFGVAVELLEADDPIEATRAYIREHSFVRAAIAVASPSLSGAIDDWLAGKTLRNPKTPLRALSYVVRMATRTTPFGLFAGVGSIDVGDATTLRLDPNGYRTLTRPDMELITRALANSPHVRGRSTLRVVTNECAFVRGDRLHVTNIALANEFASGAQQREVSLRHTKAVAFVRDFCRNGATYGATAERLCAEFNVQPADAERFVALLEEAGVVVSELTASPLGDPIAAIAERLEEAGAPEGATLRGALAACAEHDAVPPLGQTAERFAALRTTVASISSTPSTDVLQTDLRAAFSGTLGSAILSDAATLADLAMRSCYLPRLEEYRRRFIERYEGTERIVPLLELVDNELGLGFPEAPARETATDSAHTVALMRIFCEAMQSGCEEIELDTGNIDVIFPQAKSGRMPSALEVGFYIEAESARAVMRNEYRMIGGMLSERPCGLIGRFGALLGAGMLERMRDFGRHTYTGNVVAELAYAPLSSRRYNVFIRPRIYDYDVTVGVGAATGPRSISPADLYVGIEDDRFFLWSKSLASRVEVRETHAVPTIAGAPNLCRFLALAYQDNLRCPNVNLGPAEHLTYLPRITRGRVVIRSRRWRFPREAFGRTELEAARAMDAVRTRWDLPRYGYLTDGDNRLLVDLDSAVAPALIHDHANGPDVRITEVLPAPGRMWFPGSTGNHNVEFVAEALVVPDISRPVRTPDAPPLIENRPVHGPGSQWCYVRLYLGSQNADDFIVREVAPLIERLRADGSIDRWFFIRYTDPAFHLRLRMHARSREAASELRSSVSACVQSWMERSLVSRAAVDTYDPEYERYGGLQHIDAAETFFSHDSDACVALLAEGVNDTDARIEMAAATLDTLIRSSEIAGGLVLDLYAAAAAQHKLEPRDREALRRLNGQPPAHRSYGLDDVLEGDRPGRRLAAFVHMHCNRLGLDRDAEMRVCILLRSLCLSRKARRIPVG